MALQARYLGGCAALALAAVLTVSPARAQDAAALNAEAAQNDWPTHHGTYKSYHYSGLDQINAGNIKNLEVAWMHFPERATRGLQSTPLALDGVLYYSGSYSRVYALDGATGKTIWAYAPDLDEELVAKQTHSPYNRGIAIGQGNLYIGTVDGRLIALNLKTGKQVWDTKLVNSKKETVGFTGAPLLVKDMVIIGAQGGEWPGRGPIFGVDAKTGAKKWEFFTVAGTEEAMATWGNESWRTGGGGGWMPGAYDPETNSVWWGTANPAPLYDWSGPDWKKSGPRPGDNLYTTSVIALDPDTGKLKFYHQELPHDNWDFDSSVGEFVMIERGGKKLVVHPNKGGFVFVYDRSNAKIENVWRLVNNINFVKDINPKTGELIGRRDLVAGQGRHAVVPGNRRRHQLELGRLQPENRALLQDRPGVVHGNHRAEDHADPRADGATQHRRRLQAGRAAGRAGPWSSQRARSRDRRQEVGGHLQASRRSPACSPPRAIWCSCRIPRVSCTPMMRKAARRCGRATTAPATMPASSATWPAASSTSRSRRAGAAWWPTSMSRSTASPSRACRRTPAP